jgi:L-arabinonolactonase
VDSSQELDCRNDLGENVLWDDRRQQLVWSNLHQRGLWRYRRSDRAHSVALLPSRIRAVALHDDDAFLVAIGRSFALRNPATGVGKAVAEVEPRDGVRLNDGGLDRRANSP